MAERKNKGPLCDATDRILFSAGRCASLFSGRTPNKVYIFLPSHPLIPAVLREAWNGNAANVNTVWIAPERDDRYPPPVWVIRNSFSFGKLIGKINQSKEATVIGGGSSFFHRSVPVMKSHVKKIEWCFSDQGMTPVSGAVKLFHKRIFNTRWLLEKTEKSYAEKNIESRYLKTLEFVEDPMECLSHSTDRSNDTGPLKVLFIEQNPEAKNAELLEKIAKRVLNSRQSIRLYLMSNFHAADTDGRACTRIPFPTKSDSLVEVLSDMDVLLMVSEHPDPIMIKTMMSLGKVVVATAIDFVPDYIRDGVNGYLIPEYTEVGKSAEDCFIALSILAGDKPTYLEMSRKNLEISGKIFDSTAVVQQWKEIISESN